MGKVSLIAALRLIISVLSFQLEIVTTRPRPEPNLSMFFGTCFITVGLMTTSVATKFYQVFLAQGLYVGLGCGCLSISSIAIVPTYFNKRRPIAIGTASLGSGISGIIYRVEPRIGLGSTVPVIGFIALSTLLIATLLMRTRIPSSHVRRIIQTGVPRPLPQQAQIKKLDPLLFVADN